MKPMTSCWAAALAAVLAACSPVKVRPSGEGTRFEPRPKGCSLEFLDKAPGRPYEEIADLESHVTAPPPGGALEVLHDKACELGADAIIVSRNTVLNEQGHVLVAGTAIKYVERPEQPEPEQPSEEEAVPGTVDL